SRVIDWACAPTCPPRQVRGRKRSAKAGGSRKTRRPFSFKWLGNLEIAILIGIREIVVVQDFSPARRARCKPPWLPLQSHSSGNTYRSAGLSDLLFTNPMLLRFGSDRRIQAISSISWMDGWRQSAYPVQALTGNVIRLCGSDSRRHSTISSRSVRPLTTVAKRQVRQSEESLWLAVPPRIFRRMAIGPP